MSSYVRDCTGPSIGRVIHFIYHYCGLSISEHICIGQHTVTLYGKPFATFEDKTITVEGLNGWKFESDYVPVFLFDESLDNKLWIENRQNKLQRVAILESAPYEVKRRIQDVKNQFSRHKVIVNIYSENGKATWNWQAHESVIKAQAEMERLSIQLEELKKLEVEADEHEWDYLKV